MHLTKEENESITVLFELYPFTRQQIESIYKSVCSIGLTIKVIEASMESGVSPEILTDLIRPTICIKA